MGTALKPALELIIVARKPTDGTIAATFLKHGTGALNIDGCRIGWADEGDKAAAAAAAAQRLLHAEPGAPMKNLGQTGFQNGPASLGPYLENMVLGRWPANVALTHAEGCERIGTRTVRRNMIEVLGDKTGFAGQPIGGSRSLGSVDEPIEQWRCVAGCPVAELDAQSGDRPGMSGGGVHREDYAGGMFGAIDCPGVARGDRGGASRFFFTSKAARSERDAGLDTFAPMSGGAATDRKDGTDGLNSPRAGSGRNGGARNGHATVKPVDLMRWLVRLVTRPGFLVLDPFCGSGSTGVATMLESDGRRFIGLELEPIHVDFARARIAHVVGGAPAERESDAPIVKPIQVSIFEAMTGEGSK